MTGQQALQTKMAKQLSGLLTMPFRGFEGPAGTGKTHRLIEEVGQHLIQHPLDSYQSVFHGL
jgi:xanthine dehydrogenase molybdopterin-binding subunit B